MRRYGAIILVVMAGASLCGCPLKPDLITTSLATTGAIALNPSSEFVLPAQVVVRNNGTTPAGPFKVSVEYTNAIGETFTAPFTVPGQIDTWFPWVDGSLLPGAEVVFDGSVFLHASLEGTTVTLRATADSCSDDDFMPWYCRVEEINEANNVSGPQVVALPWIAP